MGYFHLTCMVPEKHLHKVTLFLEDHKIDFQIGVMRDQVPVNGHKPRKRDEKSFQVVAEFVKERGTARVLEIREHLVERGFSEKTTHNAINYAIDQKLIKRTANKGEYKA